MARSAQRITKDERKKEAGPQSYGLCVCGYPLECVYPYCMEHKTDTTSQKDLLIQQGACVFPNRCNLWSSRNHGRVMRYFA